MSKQVKRLKIDPPFCARTIEQPEGDEEASHGLRGLLSQPADVGEDEAAGQRQAREHQRDKGRPVHGGGGIAEEGVDGDEDGVEGEDGEEGGAQSSPQLAIGLQQITSTVS